MVLSDLFKKRDLSFIDVLRGSTDIFDVYGACRLVHRQIEGAFSQTGNLSNVHDKIELAKAGYNHFLELVENQPEGERRRIIKIDEMVAEGILTSINPNTVYEKPYEIWKQTDPLSAWQLYFDSQIAQETENKFNQPKVWVPVPLNGKSLVLEEAIIGPTVCELLSRLNRSDNPAVIKKRDVVVEAIYDIELERLHFFQENFPRLTPIPGDETDISKLRDVGYVQAQYINQLMDVFRNFSRYTDVDISDQTLARLEMRLKEERHHFSVREESLVRNLAATFRNSILRTGHINVPLDELLRKIAPRGKVDKELLKSMLYRVDQAPKYSHPLEDVCEMVDFPEAGLTKEQKQKRFSKAIQSHLQNERIFLNIGLPYIRMYRHLREADLLLSVYGLKLHEKREKRAITEERYDSEIKRYKEAIRYHLSSALDLCQNRLVKIISPLGYELKGTIESMQKFNKIDYAAAEK